MYLQCVFCEVNRIAAGTKTAEALHYDDDTTFQVRLRGMPASASASACMPRQRSSKRAC